MQAKDTHGVRTATKSMLKMQLLIILISVYKGKIHKAMYFPSSFNQGQAHSLRYFLPMCNEGKQPCLQKPKQLVQDQAIRGTASCIPGCFLSLGKWSLQVRRILEFL